MWSIEHLKDRQLLTNDNMKVEEDFIWDGSDEYHEIFKKEIG